MTKDYESENYAIVNSHDLADMADRYYTEPDDQDSEDQDDEQDPIEQIRRALWNLNSELRYTRKCLDRPYYGRHKDEILKHIVGLEEQIIVLEQNLADKDPWTMYGDE